jgi:hypothetical protein
MNVKKERGIIIVVWPEGKSRLVGGRFGGLSQATGPNEKNSGER